MPERYTKNELYRAVSDVLDREEYDRQIRQEIEDYGGLIDEDAAALIVVDKHCRNLLPLTPISALAPDIDATLYALVEHIGDVREFSGGRVVNSIISDETGRCVLVLWDTDVDLVAADKISEGETIKVINGYVKEGFHGIEVNIGKWGLIEINPSDAPGIEPSEEPTPLQDVDQGIVDIRATLKDISPTQVFFTSSGETFSARATLADDTGERTLVAWNQRAKRLQQFSEGDMLHGIRLYVKNGELHAGDISSFEPVG
jgi:ssDNA-binding replication factor A large subunit